MDLCLYSWIFLIIAFLLWNISTVAKYFLKFTIFCIFCVVYACGPIPLMLLKPRDSRNALIPAYLLRKSMKFLGLEYSVEGTENVIKDSGCVVLINHQSILDLIILAQLWPLMPNSTVISKKEIFYIQPFGLASWLWGTIFIDRVKAKDAQSAVNKTGETIRKRKARVLMFPEGTRNEKKELLPFKKGAFHLAVASQVPIQPVAVSRYTFLGKCRFDSGHVKLRILPAIPTEGCTIDDIPNLIDKTYKVMSENVNNLSSGKETNHSNHSNGKTVS